MAGLKTTLYPRTKLILASRSPERLRILRELFKGELPVFSPDIDETRLPQEAPQDMVLRLALAKARRVHLEMRGDVVSADTVCVLGRDILAKPRCEEEAREMLRASSDRLVVVMTGNCFMMAEGKAAKHLSLSRVQMRIWDGGTLDDYIAAGHWRERAGGFSIASPSSPVQLVDGEWDSVCGISSRWLRKMLADPPRSGE
ncbi:MAG: Maf family protein [Planctomycetes bacterium]|nr:Maf family protein [Planctomycetota bacterium]